MFDLGNGDKEKLEENMEEIKQLVNEGQNNENQLNTDAEKLKEQKNEGEQTSPDLNQIKNNGDSKNSEEIQTEELKEDTSDSGQESEVDKLAEDISQEEMAENPMQGNQLDQEFDEMQQEIKDEISSLKQTQSTHQQQRNHEQKNTPQTKENTTHDNTEQSQAQEESEAPGDLEEPDLHTRGFEEEDENKDETEGPLFLEVDNFEDMKEMIEEMHYLTAEMDDIMQHLQAGIEEDQNTMNEAEKVIQEFQTRRDKVNETLKNN